MLKGQHFFILSRLFLAQDLKHVLLILVLEHNRDTKHKKFQTFTRHYTYLSMTCKEWMERAFSVLELSHIRT